MTEILEQPPEEPEGDDNEAGGGKPVGSPDETELADTAELDEDDYEDDEDEPDK